MEKFICSYGASCEIRTEEIKDKRGFRTTTLVFDFNINSFKCCNGGWKDYQFPSNVIQSINDKLYLNLSNVVDLISVIEDFEKNQYITLNGSSQTVRGFSFFNFKDYENNIISIQESSNIEPAIWFGSRVDYKKIGYTENNNFIQYKYPDGDILITDRLHIKHEQITEFKEKLSKEIIPLFKDIYNVASLVERKNKYINNFIMNKWEILDSKSQERFFSRACAIGNLNLIKKIYEDKNTIFIKDIFSSFEEYGIELSMQPESKKVLKFFKDKIKEKNMDYSYELKKWVKDNKLGRKIKVN